MVGYAGPVVRLGDVVSSPPHSLAVQSYKPREMQSGTVNADGYGAAMWLDDGLPRPALYRTVAPIWADPNLGWMNERLRVRAALAAVRSATPGIGFELPNVQPFVREGVAFVHNGFVADFRRGVQRDLAARLGEKSFESIESGSDSEHVFALVLDEMERRHDLADALAGALETLGEVCRAHDRRAVATTILCDGRRLVASRWALGIAPATLYSAPLRGGWWFASEPLDGSGPGARDSREGWREVPAGSLAIASPGEPLRVRELR